MNNKKKNQSMSETKLKNRLPRLCKCVSCGEELIYMTKPHKKCWNCKSKEIVDNRR